MTVAPTVTERLLSQASSGIAYDGLGVSQSDSGITLTTPETTHTELTAEEIRDIVDESAPYVTNWAYWDELESTLSTANTAFLRWCEHAPPQSSSHSTHEDVDNDVPARYTALTAGEIERTWGQLHISVTLNDPATGDRIYQLRHQDDRETPIDELEELPDRLTLRDLVTFDSHGRYRPLSTAPSLQHGWVVSDCSAQAFIDAVDTIYPATIANWFLETEETLDITHWLETAERQTGMYDVTDELPREAVAWMAEACCTDTACLKRRRWEYTEDDALTVDAGAGEFPCREPCSLVIAAARTWAIAESESERSWSIKLTTSEKNQLAAIVDAVADGDIDEIREADVADGANRLRARYLRAKRMEDGDFDWTEDSTSS